MEEKYVGAVDQGTTSTRFVVFNGRGEIAALHQLEHRQIYPQPGWVEHDPMEIKERTFEVLGAALAKSGLKASQLAALGITNQRETTLAWDPRTGRPYYNAIVWQDGRTDDICRDLARDRGLDAFRAKVGLPLATYFSGPKMKWLLDNVPGLRSAVDRGEAVFGTIDAWLIWWLTGGPDGGSLATDVTNASRTMLMNLETLSWDPEMTALFGVPEKALPQIRSSSEIYGYTRPDGPLGERIPISGDLGDQQAALFGQACFEVGQAKNTYGTGCFLLKNTGSKIVQSRHGLLTTVGYKIGDAPAAYALEGSIAIGGSLVQWCRDNLGAISVSGEIETLARTVTDNGGLYFVPAFSGLFAPHWRSDARGLMIGLTHFINKGHIARAILEATAFQTREIFEAMEKDSGIELKSLKVDGGMVKNDLLMQFQADILARPVIRPKISETTALGAAYAAGFAVGFWNGLEELKANWSRDREWVPEMPEEKRESLYRQWRRAVERAKGWIE
ncbi:MAG: glycerol kinase GlpK [Pseudomonadota bacterium]